MFLHLIVDSAQGFPDCQEVVESPNGYVGIRSRFTWAIAVPGGR